MSYNKIFQMSVSTTLVAALLIGCQASDKQRTQIKRGGGRGAEQNKMNNEDGFSTNATGLKPQSATADQIEKAFTETTHKGQNKEVLVSELEDADYALYAVVYDAQEATSKKRVNLVSLVDGETVCKNTSKAGLATQSKTTNTNNNNKGTNNNNTAATQVDVCDNNKISTHSSLIAAGDKQALTGVLVTASYLRFNVQNKTLKIQNENLATFKAGYQNTSQQLVLDVLPGKAGKAEDIFAILMNAQQSQIQGKNYQLKGSQGNINATIRKLDSNTISIAFETIVQTSRNNDSRTVSMVFQYKKVAKTAETTTQQSNPSTAVTVNTGANGGNGQTSQETAERQAEKQIDVEAKNSTDQ